jgi:uncharacterized protein YecE (DUF72 family)
LSRTYKAKFVPAKGGDIRVGTYGFAYKEWVGPFYPKATRDDDKLPHYSSVFSAVEMVHTYYGAPKPNVVERWRDQTPEHFRISVKVPRWTVGGMHRAAKAGKDGDGGSADQLAKVLDLLRPLGPRLGALVVQLDPSFVYPAALGALEAFLKAWAPLAGDAHLAIVFDHPSWFADRQPEQLLKAHDAAWVWNDLEPQEPGPDRFPRAIDDPKVLRDTSSKIIYVRLSGSHTGKKTHYTPRVDRSAELKQWAALVKKRLKAAPNRTAYIMLSDHYAGVGPDTARDLQNLLTR